MERNRTLRAFLKEYHYALFAWLAIAVSIAIGIAFGIDDHVIGAVVVLIGILGQAFTMLVAGIGFLPIVGPLAAKFLALPFIWILNGIGYLVSLVAIKRGYSKDVVTYRLITIALLIGITIGYILGKLI
jgi:hypothetical protein